MGKLESEPQSDPLGNERRTAEEFQGDGREHDPAVMRAVAEALSKHLAALDRPGGGHGLVDVQPVAAQFGEWVDATAFGATAGMDSAGRKLGHVHAEFVKAYRNVIAAIEASAGNHAEADARNESA